MRSRRHNSSGLPAGKKPPSVLYASKGTRTRLYSRLLSNMLLYPKTAPRRAGGSETNHGSGRLLAFLSPELTEEKACTKLELEILRNCAGFWPGRPFFHMKAGAKNFLPSPSKPGVFPEPQTGSTSWQGRHCSARRSSARRRASMSPENCAPSIISVVTAQSL